APLLNHNILSSSHSSYDNSISSAPDVSPLENSTNLLTAHTPGTVIPNRIFVGGIDYKVNESDLRHIFSQYGAVKEVKVVMNRFGMSKGYGFVTFETQEDVLKILSNANEFCFKEKRLFVGQAVKKRQPSGQTKNTHLATFEPALPHQMSFGTFYLTTSTGYPYTYHNGVAYFHCFICAAFISTSVLSPQSVPNQYQWNTVQVPSGAVIYAQQSECLHQPTDGGSFLAAPVPVMEDSSPENRMFLPSRVHLKAKYRRFLHPKDCYRLPGSTETPDAFMFHSSQPLL
uniref:Protein boule-like n=1 Tax=Kryptolebias marmoratus TaxID=37003 RepID=A0A3Q2ZIT0_KRYMA